MCDHPEDTRVALVELRQAHPMIFVHQRLRDELAELHNRVRKKLNFELFDFENRLFLFCYV